MADRKEQKEFSQRLRDQVAAGFGAASWPDGGKIRIKTPRPAAPPGNPRPRPAPHPVPPEKPASWVLGDRILTGLAILSLGMLIVGAAGAYLSNDSQRMATTTRSDTDTASASRLDDLEKRIAQLSGLEGERLNSLEARLAQATDPLDARLKNVESRLAAPGNPDAARLKALEDRMARFDVSGYEARFQSIENRLEDAYTPTEAGLSAMENRLRRTFAAYDARLREIEGRLMRLQIPYEQRLKELERRLVYASARLDYLGAQMDSYTDTNSTILEANATLHADPPAAVPVAAFGAAPAEAPQPLPVPPVPAMQEDTAPPPAEHADADIGRPAAEMTPADALAPAEPPAQAEVAGEAPMTDEPAPDSKEPEAAIAPAAKIAGAQAAPPPAQDTPVEPAREIRQENAPSQSANGGWVINLASYASEGIASKKLADFKRKGVDAEQVAATVNGKTLYRVRIGGFDTRKAALAQAQGVGEQLGLKETWVAKQ